MRSVKPDRRAYGPSEPVPDPGIYRVIHYQHRMPHLVTISESQPTFPACRTCQQRVVFEPMFEVTGERVASRARMSAPDAAYDIDLQQLAANSAKLSAD